MQSIPVKINYSQTTNYINNYLLEDILTNQFEEKVENPNYIISKKEKNANCPFQLKKLFTEKLDKLLVYLDKGDCSNENYNKILNFVSELEKFVESNPDFKIFLGNSDYIKNKTNNEFYSNRKENIILTNLVSLLEDQLRLTDAINTKFID